MIQIIKVNKTYITDKELEKPLYHFISMEASSAAMEQLCRVLSCCDDLYFRLSDELLYSSKEYKSMKSFYQIETPDLQKKKLITILNNMYDKLESDFVVPFAPEETLIFFLINKLEREKDYLASLEERAERLAQTLEESYKLAPSTSKRISRKILLPVEKLILPSETDNMYFADHKALVYKDSAKRKYPYREHFRNAEKTSTEEKRPSRRDMKKSSAGSPKTPAAPASVSQPLTSKSHKETAHEEEKKALPIDNVASHIPETGKTEPKNNEKKTIGGTATRKQKKTANIPDQNTTYKQLSLFDLIDGL